MIDRPDLPALLRRHPLLVGLGRDPAEQDAVIAFASDLAAYLLGDPTDDLGALARVVVQVARRELEDPQGLSRGRPLLAIEAAARAAASLWPLLRDAMSPPPPPPKPEPPEGWTDPSEADDEATMMFRDDLTEEGVLFGKDRPIQDLLAGAEGDPDQEASLSGVLFAALTTPQGAQRRSQAGIDAADGAMEADRAVRHLERFLPGVGWSSAPGFVDRALLERVDDLARLLERLDDLRAIADALGRVEDEDRREGLKEGGSEEVVGVRVGGDVADALPSELALLADPLTEDLFYQRLLERRLLSLEFIGAGIEGRADGNRRGPVIACVDTSGSMAGAPEWASKALILAVCRRVLPQGRQVHLLLFGSIGETVELRLGRGQGRIEGMIDFLCMSFGAGTDFDTPLIRALDLIEEDTALRDADVLVVTDGYGRAGDEVIARVEEAREYRGLRLWSVLLGGASAKPLEEFSDQVWQVNPQQAAEAVGLVRRFVRR